MRATPLALGEHYRGASWPPVIRCSTPACVMRAPAALVGEQWACREHDEAPQAELYAMGEALAERARGELMAPPSVADAA
jgi:hypothetical protein